MAKIILLILATAVLYIVIRNHRRRVARKRDAPPAVEDEIVRCRTCGVHHPRGESLVVNGHFYCSAEHERRAREN